jgi:hypothetical protein
MGACSTAFSCGREEAEEEAEAKEAQAAARARERAAAASPFDANVFAIGAAAVDPLRL